MSVSFLVFVVFYCRNYSGDRGPHVGQSWLRSDDTAINIVVPKRQGIFEHLNKFLEVSQRIIPCMYA
jgi:hypothetical protein